MKESPQIQKFEQILRSSKLVAGGFMGHDSRSVMEIINTDIYQMSKLGYTMEQVAARMQEITETAKKGLGTWIRIDDKRQAAVEEAKGSLICPWPHPGRYIKRITTVKRLDSGETIHWSDLNIHLIDNHSFFEGRGSSFRIEPEKLISIIF